MQLQCVECDEVFYEHELAHYIEKHGFDHGPFESYHACPYCGGNYDEVVKEGGGDGETRAGQETC